QQRERVAPGHIFAFYPLHGTFRVAQKAAVSGGERGGDGATRAQMERFDERHLYLRDEQRSSQGTPTLDHAFIGSLTSQLVDIDLSQTDHLPVMLHIELAPRPLLDRLMQIGDGTLWIIAQPADR